MGHKKNKSMDFCKSGKSPLTNPTGTSKAEDLNKAATTGYNNLKKHEEKYKNNKSYKEALTKATIKKDQTSAYVEQDKNVDKALNDKKQNKGSLYDMDGTMEKMPTLGAKKLSTGSYTREHDYARTHTATTKATPPKYKK